MKFGSTVDPNISLAPCKPLWCNDRVIADPYVCAYARLLSPALGGVQGHVVSRLRPSLRDALLESCASARVALDADHRGFDAS